MPFLKNIRVKTKLLLSFIIVALLIGIVGIIGTVSLKTVDTNSQKMYDNNLQSVYMMTDMKSNLLEAKSDMMQLIYVRDVSKKDNLENHIFQARDKNNGYISRLNKMPMSNETKETYATFQSQLTQYRTLRDSVIKLVDTGNFDEAVKQYQETAKVTDAIIATVEKLINVNNEDAKAVNSDNHSIFVSSNRVIIAFMIVGLLIAIALGIVISIDINVPLMKMMNLANDLAKFDLSNSYSAAREDEFGKTAGALSKAQENIKELVKSIASNSQDMSASSEELSATVEELSSKTMEINNAVKSIASGIEETSASSEEINASVEEVDSSINELSQKAMEGSANANKSKDKATEADKNGKAAIKQVNDLYDEKKKNMLKAIEDGKIVDNIRVMADTIGGIAEQTNLLALNAAIEAARAGEQGKGFAVVAEEVRKLAEQSSEAVASIQDTIAKVQNAFKNLSGNGSDVLKFINENVNSEFEDFGEAINQYNKDADFVSSMSDQIAAMSEELTATVGQVSLAVQNMAENSQKSAESVDTIKGGIDETAKAIDQVALTAQSQAELAQTLNEMVQKFKL